jgi:hypothetical protein
MIGNYDTVAGTHMTSSLSQRAQAAVGIACLLAIAAMTRYRGAQRSIQAREKL